MHRKTFLNNKQPLFTPRQLQHILTKYCKQNKMYTGRRPLDMSYSQLFANISLHVSPIPLHPVTFTECAVSSDPHSVYLDNLVGQADPLLTIATKLSPC